MPLCAGTMWDTNTFVGILHLPVPLRAYDSIDMEISDATDLTVLSNGTNRTVTTPFNQVTHHQQSISEIHFDITGTLTAGHGAWARLNTGVGKYFRIVSEL